MKAWPSDEENIGWVGTVAMFRATAAEAESNNFVASAIYDDWWPSEEYN